MSMDANPTQSATKLSKPLLVYDGECGFCIYSVRYWEKLTGDRVTYHPYQQVMHDYPEISVTEFKRAVQYISPEGQVASGAKASFLTLNQAEGGSWWLTFYNRLPGFSFLAEKAYSLVSTHRNFAYRVSKVLWGKDPEPPTCDGVTWLFLRLLGLLFLSAFYSFAIEAQGLIGSDGILPVANLLQAAYSQVGDRSYWLLPTVFWLNSSDLAIQVVCWSGVVLSVFLTLNIFPRLCLLGLYVLYLSLVYAGQTFMTFQWDMLLLETAILAIILIRYRTLGIWLLRWLVFRYIFVSGIVKVASGDPAWWDLTALNYHFLTQPLPTSLAWYAYYFPEPILKFATGASLFIELVMPFFIFMPRRLRFLAGFSVLLMQTGIILTGNYNFFNFTTVVICLTLFDDAALQTLIPTKLFKNIQQHRLSKAPWRLTNFAVVIFTVWSVVISFAEFNLRFIGFAPTVSSEVIGLLAPLQMVNTYGPFAVMTRKRYEIIIEGSNDGANWREYKFKYKPDELDKKPRWNIPLQPRLDWQMWFAALGPPEASPWFAQFLKRLLENSPSVTALLADNPFPDMPPVFVRALYFDYTYTTAAEYRETGAWWNRSLVATYIPSVSLK